MASWTFFENQWHQGNPPIMGPMDHAPWLASTIFDGARTFEGVTPDLDLHCQRAVRSAENFGLKQLNSAGELEEIIRDGIAKFDKTAELYLRPMAWATGGFVTPDPETTVFSVSVYDEPMPNPAGFSIMCSRFRRPSNEYAPTEVKAACHYPNSARALREAAAVGFDNAVMLDPLGHVAELSTANIFYVKDGEVHTPVPNGCFLNGITRQRVIKLLEATGTKVHQRALTWQEFENADEIFSTGNFAKLMPANRINTRDLQPGPVYAKARELYWEFAHSG